MKLQNGITMKRILTREVFKRHYILLFLLSIVAGPTIGQQAFSKKYEESFENVDFAKLKHRNGLLQIRKSDDGKLKVTATISLTAGSQTEADVVFDHFKLDSDQLGDRVSIETEFKTKKWNSNNGVANITFVDGARVKDIRDLKIDFVVYTPKLEELAVEHKYGPIKIEDDLAEELKLELYEGRLEAENVEGRFFLDMKYSKAVVGNFGTAELVMYDSKLFAENGGNAAFDMKYSEVELKNLGNVSIKSYENKIEFANIGNLQLEDKYSDYVVGNFGNAVLDAYESDFQMMRGGNFQAKSKYSKYDIESLGNMSFEFSYEDKVKVRKLSRLIGASKYSNFDIGVLGNKLALEAYEGTVNIEEFAGPIEEINFNGKYTDLELDLPTDTKFWLDAEVQYGRFSFPDGLVEVDYYHEKNDKLEIKGKVKGSTDDSPKIRINAYEGRISLN